MSSWKGDPNQPDPKIIGAYGDGELDGDPRRAALRRQVEKWLASHPECAEELAAQRLLAKLWQDTPPSEVDDAAWPPLLGRIEARVRQARQKRRRSRLPAALWTLGVLSAAASLAWLAVTLWLPADRQTARLGQPQNPRPAPAEFEVLEVAHADEVEVLQVGGADANTLVVGDPFVQGPLVLAQPGDVTFTRVDPAHDNTMPEVLGSDPTGSVSPMILTPLPR
jgi:hypothetical protein